MGVSCGVDRYIEREEGKAGIVVVAIGVVVVVVSDVVVVVVVIVVIVADVVVVVAVGGVVIVVVVCFGGGVALVSRLQELPIILGALGSTLSLQVGRALRGVPLKALAAVRITCCQKDGSVGDVFRFVPMRPLGLK